MNSRITSILIVLFALLALTFAAPMADALPEAISEVVSETEAVEDTRPVLMSRGMWGKSTYYYQNGVTAKCGQVYQDNVYIAALAPYYFEGGRNPCNKRIWIKAQSGKGKGRTLVATVVDRCAGCVREHVDLAVEPFKRLAGDSGLDIGVLQIEWGWTN
ncbi:Similar to Putative ripening-related protein 6; acc. no. Q7XD66 [Pyronema omphalodes CBS 100304]|uniref:Similar to Putative ripening-related protein 6 acc. no. Q7XD66 n=1 Tax=Pyronema omphalodes (strain CBS 100304) TaxID=1076935 RepID=U4LG37_PYROM|nr:Similar to Putative ripening-related protein 6; acc. no. Q7XD66 [Pyronema omphalodes CBS 100304]